MNKGLKNSKLYRLLFKSSWGYGISALILLLTTLVYAQFFSSDLGNIIEQKKLQNNINSICNSMDAIEKNLENKNPQYNFFNDTLLSKLHKAGLSAFVYSDDSLIAWSDNDYILSNDIVNDRISLEHIQNVYVLIKEYKLENISLKLSYPIRTSYNFENEYLRNELNPRMGIIKKTYFVDDIKGSLKIFSPKGDVIAHNIWEKNSKLNSFQQSLLFFIFMLSFAFMLQFLRKIVHTYFSSRIVSLFVYISFVLIISFIVTYFKLPKLLYESAIFDPSTFASSPLISSLGSLFIITTCGLFLLFGISDYLKNLNNAKQEKFAYLFLYSVLFFLLILLKNIVANLVFNSTISFDITQLSSINSLSIIGLIAIGVWVYSYSFILSKGSELIRRNINNQAWLMLIIVSVFALIYTTFNQNIDYYTWVFFLITTVFNLLFSKGNTFKTTSINTVYLLAFSFLLSLWLNNLNSDNELSKRKSIIQSIAINQDPKVEYLFSEISKKIYSDEELLTKFQNENLEFDSITAYIENTYFRGYKHFDKYDFQTTICTKDLKLIIRPQNVEVICDTFFYENLIQYGTLTSDQNLYLLNYGTGQVNYLGLFRFLKMTNDGYMAFTVYVEINSKLKRKGFTKLLSSGEYDPFEKIANYSLATYENNKRVENYGDYGYPEHFTWNIKGSKDLTFYDYQNYSHLIYQLDDNKIYVLSRKIPPTLSKVAPFSYLLIIFSFLFILLNYFSNYYIFKSRLKLSFAGRLQIAMISIIFISFAVISSITLFYINKLNEDKNAHRLKDLATALQTEFEHKLSNEDDLSTVDSDYLNSLLMKFSKVFDTDINIYHLDGRLLSSTRYEIFNYPLLSNLMNPKAYNYLTKEHQNLFITKENIGSLVYSSAYLPFHNRNGENIAFINLPYFARQEVLKQEVLNLLMTLMNVYALIIVLAILVILIVSNYASRPLAILKKHMQEVGIGKANKKIEWQGIEEINALVDEYNRMIDALAISSSKLAKSERESAWREMAKQVAHEIKNPLTPMKLSVQYMMRTFDNTENQKERIESLSNTLIEQIDTLADIASAFSDFADMPKSMIDIQEINSIIKAVTELYSDRQNVNIELDCKEKYWVYIDKSQWIRVFNNLIKNSIQAVSNDGEVNINISLYESNSRLIIEIKDNGKGVAEDMKEMIFSPKFTTKTKGAGLGLAMVRNIVSNSDGNIKLESSDENGSVFIIDLPLSKS